MENRIKIPFHVTLASTKGIKNFDMRFSDFNRKEEISQMKENFVHLVKEIKPEIEKIETALKKHDIPSERLGIIIDKEGYLEISVDCKLKIRAVRYNAEHAIEVETREIIE